MPVNDDLGRRMKENYEEITQYKLTRRTPVAIRLDGRAFHTFTKGFSKPFDRELNNTMERTALYLCKNIQGCKLAYTQSDEITLILTDYDTLETNAWFDYKLQKMCSIAASMATMKFNQVFAELANKYIDYVAAMQDFDIEEEQKHVAAYKRALEQGAMFDARCFNVPKEEVANLIIWRWMDAKRNSIQMVGQANFSHKELQGKTCANIIEMLETVDPWDYYCKHYLYGTIIYKFEGVWNCFAAPDNHEDLRFIVNKKIGYDEDK